MQTFEGLQVEEALNGSEIDESIVDGEDMELEAITLHVVRRHHLPSTIMHCLLVSIHVSDIGRVSLGWEWGRLVSKRGDGSLPFEGDDAGTLHLAQSNLSKN